MTVSPYTTIENIRATAGHLNTVQDTALTLILEDAALEVSDLQVPDKYREKLTRYLAIHLATMKPQNVVKEKLDVLERTYATGGSLTGLDSTPYGAEYQRMVKEYSLETNKKPSLNLMVL